MEMTEESITVGAAVDQLGDAVAGLVDPIKEMLGGEMRLAPSLYEQLRGEVAVSGGGERVRRWAASRAPVWLDAVELLAEVDVAVAAWQPAGGSTPERLHLLVERKWRPQDVRGVGQICAAVKSWTMSVAGLLEPDRVKEIRCACPSCGTRYVYRQSDGERVRRPALQLVAEKGCTCLSCGASWQPDQYLWLVRLLGGALPPGVLE